MTITRRTLLKSATMLGGAALASRLTGTAFAQSETLKIGFLAPLSGSQEIIGRDMLAGATIAMEQVNAAGGINGQQLELVVRDEKSDPATAVAVAKELTGSGVKLLAGAFASNVGLALAPVAEAEGAVMVFCSPSTPDLTHQSYVRNIFRVTDQSFMRQRACAKLMAENFPDSPKWGTVALQNATGEGAWNAFADGLLEYYPSIAKQQVQLSEPIWAKFGAPDYKNEILKTMRMDAQGFFLMLSGGDTVTFIQQGAPYKVADKFQVMVDPSTEFFTAQALGAAIPKNMWSAFHWYYGAYRGNKISDDLYDAYVAKTGNKYPSGYTGESHTGILALVNAIKNSGSTDPDTIISAMEGMTFDSCKGERTLRKEDHQALCDVNFVRFEPDTTSSEGFKVAEFKIIKGADVVEPPSPGQPLVYQFLPKA